MLKRMKMMMLALMIVPFAIVLTACTEGGATPGPEAPAVVGTPLGLDDAMMRAWNGNTPTLNEGVVTYTASAVAGEQGEFGNQGGFIRLDAEYTTLVFSINTTVASGEWLVMHIGFNCAGLDNVGGVNIAIRNDGGQLFIGNGTWADAAPGANNGIPNMTAINIPVANLNNIAVSFSDDFTTFTIGGQTFDSFIEAGEKVESLRTLWLVRTSLEEVAVSNIRVA